MTYREPMTLDERHAIWALYELIDRVPLQTAKGFIRDLEKLSHIGLVEMTTPQRTWLFNLILNHKKRIADEHVELARAFFDRIHGRGDEEVHHGGHGGDTEKREEVSG